MNTKKFSVPRNQDRDIDEGNLWLGCNKGMIVSYIKVHQSGLIEEDDSDEIPQLYKEMLFMKETVHAKKPVEVRFK